MDEVQGNASISISEWATTVDWTKETETRILEGTDPSPVQTRKQRSETYEERNLVLPLLQVSTEA